MREKDIYYARWNKINITRETQIIHHRHSKKEKNIEIHKLESINKIIKVEIKIEIKL